MTCREKLKREHPYYVNEKYNGGCFGCPFIHGYMAKPNYCNGKNLANYDAICGKCWDREIPGTEPTTIYYAHHQWKYGTKIEEYELDIIKKNFPNAVIFNPATDLEFKDCGNEEIIMDECLSKMMKSDIVIFSCMDGMIGIGVYKEVEMAKAAGKLILCISQNCLRTEFIICESPEFNSDRLYARVGVPMFD